MGKAAAAAVMMYMPFIMFRFYILFRRGGGGWGRAVVFVLVSFLIYFVSWKGEEGEGRGSGDATKTHGCMYLSI